MTINKSQGQSLELGSKLRLKLSSLPIWIFSFPAQDLKKIFPLDDHIADFLKKILSTDRILYLGFLATFSFGCANCFLTFVADDFSLLELPLLAVKLHFLSELQINENP